jgi:hypothetical protein
MAVNLVNYTAGLRSYMEGASFLGSLKIGMKSDIQRVIRNI